MLKLCPFYPEIVSLFYSRKLCLYLMRKKVSIKCDKKCLYSIPENLSLFYSRKFVSVLFQRICLYSIPENLSLFYSRKYVPNFG
jgi:hypothetical protein